MPRPRRVVVVRPADARSGGKAPLYDTGVLRTIFLEFENAEWEKELEAFYNTDVEVPATLTVDGAVYRDVGVHFRGASSFMFVPEGSKRSLNVAIDFVHEDQRLLGYRTLNLLNVNSDPTFTRALLYAEVSRHYLPTPKANYLRVAINGESWGVYVNTQQYNSDFLREWFKTTRGARWKVPGSPFGQGGMRYLGEDLEAYKKIYEIKTRDDPKSWAALTNVFKVLTETPLDTLEATLTPIFNIDGALRFLALEIALVNTDGYWTRASDYNIYLDEQGRIHILPHDVNEAFEEEGAGPGRGRGGPPPAGPAPAAAGQRGAAPPRRRAPWTASVSTDVRPSARRSRSAHRPRRCDEATQVAVARGAGPASALPCVRAGDRPEVVGLEYARAARPPVPERDRRRGEGRYAQAVLMGALSDRRGRRPQQPQGLRRSPTSLSPEDAVSKAND